MIRFASNDDSGVETMANVTHSLQVSLLVAGVLACCSCHGDGGELRRVKPNI